MFREDEDFRRIYEYSELVRNTEGQKVDGKEQPMLSSNFDDMGPLLVQLEALMRDIGFNDDWEGVTWQRDNKNQRVLVETPLGKYYYPKVAFFLQHHANTDGYVCSPYVEALREAHTELNLGAGDRSLDGIAALSMEEFNKLLVKAAEILESAKFRENLRVRRRSADRNEAKGLAIEQQAFGSNSCVRVYVLHLGYELQHRFNVTLQENQQHRKKFFNNYRDGIVEYIWKNEQGEDTGLHLQLLVFYSADSCQDVDIVKQIGKYWVKVTGGKGKYWNSNTRTWFHQKYGHDIGAGEINRDDHAKREALRTYIRYMVWADLFLKMQYSDGCRLFGTSQIKDKEAIVH
ncbi:inovirus-type Gp2 protein [Burkholderia seminalis]|uniref:inovirus-type Gp2 protein n=1 Tax=Burkholderia seminalis TaxID=488731 RepID=UPI00158BEDAF|nr:inovirus-type Gp2 protein [Burkholderia seminalis]